MSDTAWLLVLFVVLPVILAPLVIAFVARRSPSVPPEHRTSWLLEHGEPRDGVLVSWKNKGPFLLDSQPMVAMRIEVDGRPAEVTQPVPHDVSAKFVAGMRIEVRMSPDGRAGAVVLPD